MDNSSISDKKLEKYWKIVQKEKPKLFKNRNNSKRNKIAYHILDLWEDDAIKKRFGNKISDQKFYEEKALIFTLHEYSEILDFVNNKDKDYCVYIWRCWNDGKLFYVGKGKKYRARNKTNRKKYFKNIIESNHCFYQIFKNNMMKIDAFKLENDLINALRI